MALPQLFLERLAQLFPEEKQYRSVLDSFSVSKKIAVRINTLKCNRDDLIQRLTDLHITFSKVEWFENALLLENVSTKDITELSLYKEGEIYIQSLSSMIPALVINPDKNDKILDMAAAPGSKTTQLAAMMSNEGEIIANDISHERIYKLKANLIMHGVTNVKVTNTAGQSIWQKYPEYFDKVLVDAPCSMEGRFNVEDADTYADWSMKKIKRLSKLQKWLLRSAVSTTKVGGVIVYSTCTLSPEENEEVINWILQKEQGNVELEEVTTLQNLGMINGVTRWMNDQYSEELHKTKRIMPSDTIEGFYIAKLRKIRTNMLRSN